MKKILLSFILSMLVAFQPAVVLAESHEETATKTEAKKFELDLGGEIPGPTFRAGDFVSITEDLEGDVYVAGGNVAIDAVIDGDLFVAGGTVTFNGEVTEDLRIVGGSLMLNGQVGQDVSVAGGTVNFGSESQVGGSVMAAGGSINYNGQILGNLLTGAGQAKLAGDFGQNVRMGSGTFEVGPEAVIGGDLVAKYEETSNISEEAEILGETQVEKSYYEEKLQQSQEKMTGIAKGFDAAGTALSTAMAIVSGLVLIFLFPKLSQKLSKQIIDKPFASLGWGLVKLFLAPIVMILLLMTVVAMPLAGILFVFYLVSLSLASWVAALAVGQRLAKEFEVKFLQSSYWQFVVGLILLKLVGLIPLFGGLTRFALFLMGLGAIFSWAKNEILAVKR